MKRKICTTLSALAILTALAFPASAARWQCITLPSGCGLPVSCWQQCPEHACPDRTPPDTDCSGGSCTEQPTQPDTPSTPEQPSEPETPETPERPSRPEGSSVLAEESAVVSLVNEIRAQYGLSALTLDENLCRYARVKSQDMQQKGYFSHESPTYGSPFDMMRAFGISYSYAGENIAMGYSSAQSVVDAWMNSASHRANILSANFTSIGVGYVANGGYWTQWFLG